MGGVRCLGQSPKKTDFFDTFPNNQKSLLPHHMSPGKLNLQTMADEGEYFSLEELAAEENLTLDPSACGNITAEYMLVGCHQTYSN